MLHRFMALFPGGPLIGAPDRGPQGSLAGLPDPLLRAAGGPRQLPTSLGWARLACFLGLIWLGFGLDFGLDFGLIRHDLASGFHLLAFCLDLA